MRKSPISVLAQHILQMDPNITQPKEERKLQLECMMDVLCCTAYHGLKLAPWTLCAVPLCLQSLTHTKPTESPLCVIFDTYDVATTQSRNAADFNRHHVVVTIRTPVPSNKTAFLSNKTNKQNLIKLLSVHLEEAGISVEHAGDEGDANVVIEKKTLEILENQQPVHVIADDTDILILLLHHACDSSDIYLCTKHHIICIKIAQEVLGRELCMCLLFAHAL